MTTLFKVCSLLPWCCSPLLSDQLQKVIVIFTSATRVPPWQIKPSSISGRSIKKCNRPYPHTVCPNLIVGLLTTTWSIPNYSSSAALPHRSSHQTWKPTSLISRFDTSSSLCLMFSTSRLSYVERYHKPLAKRSRNITWLLSSRRVYSLLQLPLNPYILTRAQHRRVFVSLPPWIPRRHSYIHFYSQSIGMSVSFPPSIPWRH